MPASNFSSQEFSGPFSLWAFLSCPWESQWLPAKPASWEWNELFNQLWPLHFTSVSPHTPWSHLQDHTWHHSKTECSLLTESKSRKSVNCLKNSFLTTTLSPSLFLIVWLHAASFFTDPSLHSGSPSVFLGFDRESPFLWWKRIKRGPLFVSKLCGLHWGFTGIGRQGERVGLLRSEEAECLCKGSRSEMSGSCCGAGAWDRVLTLIYEFRSYQRQLSSLHSFLSCLVAEL